MKEKKIPRALHLGRGGAEFRQEIVPRLADSDGGGGWKWNFEELEKWDGSCGK